MRNHFIRDKRVRFGSITVLLIVLVIAVTVLVNAVFGALANRYLWYSYMNGYGAFEVTEDCYAILAEGLAQNPGEQVEIIFCNLPEKLCEETTTEYVYTTATSIAERFPDRVKVSCHDILINPDSVRAYRTTLDPITGDTIETNLKKDSVIIVGKDYHRVYSLTEFFVFEDGDTSKLWAYNGEKKLASGILRAVAPTTKMVCLTNNHGEIFYDYELLYLLDDAGYGITYMDLTVDKIPENCHLIISYNPNSDLMADGVSVISECDILDDFLSKEGNAFLVFMENGTPSLPNFEKYLGEWGVGFSYYTNPTTKNSYRYMVQDSAGSLTSDGYTIYGYGAEQGRAHELVGDPLRRTVFKNATALYAAQGFENRGDGSYVKGDRTMYSLYTAGDNAVSWANGAPVAADEAILMSLTEQTCGAGRSYVGVVASVDFSEETFLQSAVHGNSDTLLKLLREVNGGILPYGLTIKPFESTTISSVTTTQMWRWTLLLALTPALLFTALGVVILVKRRHA